MLILEPLKQFLVERHLNNPSDTNTYYCRATITDAVTGEVLSTFDLTDNGGKDFSKLWATPNDMSGTGRQIVISTTVYDDSGYTTESTAYGTEKITYIVRVLAGPRVLGGYAGNGGGGVDYDKLEKLLERKIKEIKIPEQKEYDDAGIILQLSQLSKQLKQVRQGPDPEDKSAEIIGKILASDKFKKLDQVIALAEKFKEAEKSDDELHSHIQDVLKQIREDQDMFKVQVDSMISEAISEMAEKVKSLEESVNRPVKIEAVRSRKEEEPKDELLPSPREIALKKLFA